MPTRLIRAARAASADWLLLWSTGPCTTDPAASLGVNKQPRKRWHTIIVLKIAGLVFFGVLIEILLYHDNQENGYACTTSRCSVCVSALTAWDKFFEHETNGIWPLGLPAPESAWAEEMESPKSASETSVRFSPNGWRCSGESWLETGNWMKRIKHHEMIDIFRRTQEEIWCLII